MTREALHLPRLMPRRAYTQDLCISSIRAGAGAVGVGAARRGGRLRLRGARRRARAGRVPAGAVSPVSVYIARIIRSAGAAHPTTPGSAPSTQVGLQYTAYIHHTAYLRGTWPGAFAVRGSAVKYP